MGEAESWGSISCGKDACSRAPTKEERRPLPIKTLIAGILMLTGAALVAQTPSPQPQEIHQFDFWLGDWDVFDAQGNPGGKSRIESIAEGNGLLENWTDSSGTTGKSLNTYNPDKKCWQQFWVGNGTPVLELSGGIVDGSMVLIGTRRAKGNASVTDRISWKPNPDGSVRQHWESSVDGGKTWKDDFDGIYRRQPPHQPAVNDSLAGTVTLGGSSPPGRQ